MKLTRLFLEARRIQLFYDDRPGRRPYKEIIAEVRAAVRAEFPDQELIDLLIYSGPFYYSIIPIIEWIPPSDELEGDLPLADKFSHSNKPDFYVGIYFDEGTKRSDIEHERREEMVPSDYSSIPNVTVSWHTPKTMTAHTGYIEELLEIMAGFFRRYEHIMAHPPQGWVGKA